MLRAPLLAVALPLALSLAACSGSSPSTETPAGADSASFEQTVPQGTPVYVNRGGQWLPASVVRQTGAASVFVHYEGAPSSYDENVPFERVRSRPAGASAAAAPADYKPGEQVIVSAQNRLLMAEIVQAVGDNNFRVHYSGYGPDVVENVSADRIKKPFTGQTAHPVGEAVTVDVGAAQPMPGKVIGAVAADQWIVRIDNAGPQYDQQVGADRIHAAQAAPAPTAPPPATTPPVASAAPGAGKAPGAGGAAPGAGKAPDKAAEPLKAGDAVLLKVRSVYYPAKIVAAGGSAGSFKVRVDGQSADEEATAGNLVRLQDPLKGIKYQAAQEVFVEWHGVYVPGKVVKEADTGNYRVKVVDAEEIVNVKRIRPR